MSIKKINTSETIEMLFLSSRNRQPIFTTTKETKNRLLAMAQGLKINIPEPVIFSPKK